MSDTDNNHTNGNGAEHVENTQKETAENKVSWVDTNLESLEAVDEAEETVEQPVEKPKRKAKAKTGGTKKAKGKAKTAIPLDDFGFRKGTVRSKAAAMYARPNGATLSEVKAKLGTVQYNALTEVKNRGFKVTTKEEAGEGNRPATRFFLKSKKR